MPTAMVTFNGRITLPSEVRNELGLKTGDSVNFVEVEKGRFAIYLRPAVSADQNFPKHQEDGEQKLDLIN